MLFRQGDEFYWDERLYDCLYCDPFSIVIKEKGCIESIHVSSNELNTAYMKGLIKTLDELGQQANKGQQILLSDLSMHLQKVINCRMAYVNLLNESGLTSTESKNAKRLISQGYGLMKPPGNSTIYRWRKRYKDSHGSLLSLLDERFRRTRKDK